EFDESKIYNSIRGASRDLDRSTLNESDLNMLIADIKAKLNKIRNDESLTSSFEIVGVVCRVLKDDGFINVLEAYLAGQ
ncbi:MAG: hypothetical protein MSA89_09040, partial [Clostridium sp.]|nr:hypothetical protein [Clostridium sp.]